MGQSSGIEWTDATWNPVTGCTKVSPGCANCYAESFALRLQGAGNRRYARGFAVTLHWDRIEEPLGWEKEHLVFVNSMGDLFHDKVPTSFVQKVFEVMASAEQHTFQVLTKRSSRLAELSSRLPWPSNVWMGVSVETEPYLCRLDELRTVPAAVRFVSFEPLLGPVARANLKGIDWVIVGGESGARARPMEPSWVRQIRSRCKACHLPFFFKQWGGKNKKSAGRLLDGRTWDEFPEVHMRSRDKVA